VFKQRWMKVGVGLPSPWEGCQSIRGRFESESMAGSVELEETWGGNLKGMALSATPEVTWMMRYSS
jgi:hypothetical protein